MNFLTRRSFLRSTGGAVLGAAAAHALPGRCASAAAGGPVKIGQIGTGHAHASGKMSTLRKLTEDFEVLGVVEPDPERRKAAENQPVYRGLRWMTEEELLNTKGLRAVAVETAVADLVPTAARCIAAGMHLHLDKPAGHSLAAFKTVLDDATRRGLVVQMGYMFRNNPAFQLCFRAAAEHWLGELFELHGVISKTLPARTRKELARVPGGAMFELGCHLIDAMVAVLGRPQRVTPYGRKTRPEQDDLLDNCLAVFEYPEATATIRSALVEVDGFRRRQFVVCGDAGTVDIHPLEPPKLLLALEQAREPYRRGYQEVELAPMPGRYDGQLAELAQIVRGQKQSPYPPEHDLAVHEAILRASGLPTDPGPAAAVQKGGK